MTVRTVDTEGEIPHDAVVLLTVNFAPQIAEDMGVFWDRVDLEWDLAPDGKEQARDVSGVWPLSPSQAVRETERRGPVHPGSCS